MCKTRAFGHLQSRCLPTQLRQYSQSNRELKSLLRISPELQDAIANKQPVVALESTIYTHGALGRDLPQILDEVVRRNGAVPATIGVLDGVPTIGLSPNEIDRMVDEGARKISRRDFAYIVGAVSSLNPSRASKYPAQLQRRASTAARSMAGPR